MNYQIDGNHSKACRPAVAKFIAPTGTSAHPCSGAGLALLCEHGKAVALEKACRIMQVNGGAASHAGLRRRFIDAIHSATVLDCEMDAELLEFVRRGQELDLGSLNVAPRFEVTETNAGAVKVFKSDAQPNPQPFRFLEGYNLTPGGYIDDPSYTGPRRPPSATSVVLAWLTAFAFVFIVAGIAGLAFEWPVWIAGLISASAAFAYVNWEEKRRAR